MLNALRRDAVAMLEAARAAAWQRLPRATPVEPPATFPEDTLTYLANVFNHKARDFYAKHGVRLIAAAYESHEEEGEVSLMITKHCVRWSMSLCPKQAKGVTGVQGTIRAEPLTLINGNERLGLRFDCKPCEMHVVGRMRRHVLDQGPRRPVDFLPDPARPGEFRSPLNQESPMKILLPIDSTELALHEVRFALRLATEGLKARFLLANVQEPASFYEIVTAHDAAVLETISHSAGEHALQPALDLLHQAGMEAEKPWSSPAMRPMRWWT
jgi:hypothetical protein